MRVLAVHANKGAPWSAGFKVSAKSAFVRGRVWAGGTLRGVIAWKAYHKSHNDSAVWWGRTCDTRVFCVARCWSSCCILYVTRHWSACCVLCVTRHWSACCVLCVTRHWSACCVLWYCHETIVTKHLNMPSPRWFA